MRNPLFGLIGLVSGVAGCLIFVALLMFADKFDWLNPQAGVVLVLVLGFFALVLGISSIKTTVGKLSTTLGCFMLAFFLIITPTWTTVGPGSSSPNIEVQNSRVLPD